MGNGRQIDALISQVIEYKSKEVYGIFLMGKRIRSITGKFNWSSEKSAKLALHYMVRSLKRRDWENGYYQKSNVANKEMKDFLNVNQLLSDKIFEIKQVGWS